MTPCEKIYNPFYASRFNIMDLNAVTINKTYQLRSIRRIFFLPKSAISDLAAADFHTKNINRSHDSFRAQYGWRTMCRVDTIRDCLNSAILIGRNCYPSMTILLNFAKAQVFLCFFFSIIPPPTAREDREEKMGGVVGLNGPRGLGVQTPCPPSHKYQLNLTDIYPRIVWWTLQ